MFILIVVGRLAVVIYTTSLILSVMTKKNSQTMAIASISPSIDRDCDKKRRLRLCAGADVMIFAGLDNS